MLLKLPPPVYKIELPQTLHKLLNPSRMYEKEGILSALVGAFQPPASEFDKPHYPPKQIFVSDKMAERPELISDNLLEKGGYFFMCGPAVATPSVQKALKAALVKHGQNAGSSSRDLLSFLGVVNIVKCMLAASNFVRTLSARTLSVPYFFGGLKGVGSCKAAKHAEKDMWPTPKTDAEAELWFKVV
ncbi:hypothetical protein AK812_SmicGene421 [Symbiodinium microadriaticum]|uniref:Uncharacterized protein n=1 Tax=Symbiodinium microadriaticum TaxID=2951 RepID=A0A1Q9F6Y7_SYMMI|nr:hypothetical protein AK812_SmicGene421 [Symbiodinium microadriaticum]